MTGWHLFRWVLWRGILSGAVLGILYAETIFSIYVFSGYFAVCFLSLIVGALFGAGLGGILGIINGFALVILTHFFSSPIRSLRLYRLSALLLTTICTVTGCILAAHIVFDDLVYVLVPVTILATIASGYFVWRLPIAPALPSSAARSRPANAVLFYIEK